MGKSPNSIFKSRQRMENAGFVNIKEKTYKVPLGEWAKNPLLKEAGRFCRAQLLEGLEGVSSIFVADLPCLALAQELSRKICANADTVFDVHLHQVWCPGELESGGGPGLVRQNEEGD